MAMQAHCHGVIHDDVVYCDGVAMDRWIIGEGADHALGYVIHWGAPRFICKFAVEAESPHSVDEILYADDGYVFWDFLWVDGEEPNRRDFTALMKEAVDAMARQMLR